MFGSPLLFTRPAPPLNREVTETLILLGLALAYQGELEQAQIFYEALEELVPQRELLLWLQASYDWVSGRAADAAEKAQQCPLPEAQALLQLLQGEALYPPLR